MAERLAAAARRLGNAAQSAQLIWPAAEASIASYVVREIEVGERVLPHPGDADLNSLLAEVAGSLFTDIEAKAPFWQRSRSPLSAVQVAEPVWLGAETEELAEVRAMAESFRSAYLNLQEIWSLVLPPQSLLALKKLSLAPPESFLMPADLWARVVYDFVLAYHLRTINRGHLLGALTPLYLAWVTSHLRRSAGDAVLSSQHVEETASAFSAEKPYVVARWRWPDRFGGGESLERQLGRYPLESQYPPAPTNRGANHHGSANQIRPSPIHAPRSGRTSPLPPWIIGLSARRSRIGRNRISARSTHPSTAHCNSLRRAHQGERGRSARR